MIAASVEKDILEVVGECKPLSPLQQQWFVAQGVPEAFLTSAQAPVFGRVWFDEEGLFEPDPSGEGALVFVIPERGGQPSDLVAWQPKQGRLASWLRRAVLLGNPFQPRLRADKALPVWRSPLGWMKASGDGICLVQAERAARALEGLGPLLAEDIEHGMALAECLAIPAPRILVPEEAAP